MLAARLNAAGMHHAASLCYVCSGNVDAAVAYWAHAAGGPAEVNALQVWVCSTVLEAVFKMAGARAPNAQSFEIVISILAYYYRYLIAL